MKKLCAVIRYECATSFKYIWIFYAIEYLVIAFITVILAITMDGSEKIGTNCLEMNTFIYVGILGILGFKADFRMLIQHGFTRKYIFFGTISMFVFISGMLALVDTITGNVLHLLSSEYNTLFAGVYGYGNLAANWSWLFLVNLFICSIFYLVILIINRLDRQRSLYLGIGMGAFIVLCVALFRFAIPMQWKEKLGEISVKVVGFMEDGTINFAYPLLTLCLLIGILGIASYAVIRRTELRK